MVVGARQEPIRIAIQKAVEFKPLASGAREAINVPFQARGEGIGDRGAKRKDGRMVEPQEIEAIISGSCGFKEVRAFNQKLILARLSEREGIGVLGVVNIAKGVET